MVNGVGERSEVRTKGATKFPTKVATKVCRWKMADGKWQRAKGKGRMETKVCRGQRADFESRTINSSVEVQCCAGNETVVLGSKIDHRPRNIGGRAGPAERNGANRFVGAGLGC